MQGHQWRSLLLLLLWWCAVTAVALEDTPIVTLKEGQVQGRSIQRPDADLPQYFAYEGIPYAAPPVGTRRFKDPEEPEPWTDVRNATETGPICIQKSLITYQIEGEEDCLFINVYTTSPPTHLAKHQKLPVVVWIHAGFFLSGGGNFDLLRPDALLREGVIVVSFNYRVGVMGFLNTQDSQAPGNAGMKDALMALRWVRRNIEAFGGDCEKVTIFGNGAGGAIVNHLLLTPESEGLVHRAMSMSGVALSTWTHVANPRENALALAERFNASCAADDGIVSCLQRIDARDLVDSEDSAAPADWEYRFWKIPFFPSLETPGSSPRPLVTAPPEQLMRSGRFLHVPYIMGFTSAECINYLWISGTTSNASRWAYIEENFEPLFMWAMPPGLRTPAAVSKMRQFYLGNTTLYDAANNLDTINRFVQMCSDLFVTVSAVSAARLMTQSEADVYVYEFAFEGAAPYFKDEVYNASQVPGVAHGDDLFYLFERAADPSGPPLNATPEERSVRERWVRYFTNFAKTGNPTPSTGRDRLTWKKYTLEEEKYLYVDKQFTVGNHVLESRIIFWRQLTQCQISGACEQNPIVRTAQGDIRGQQKLAVTGSTYFSWNGVPYAKPPVGDLRFKDALSPEPWEGVRDALQDGSMCIQPRITAAGWPLDGSTIGSEDCLFINIYSPQLPTWLVDSLPVLAWVHGGGFVTGSNIQATNGPDYIVSENVIMVSLNYRLGVFGFLYLNESAPGNAGMKDQVMALRWVQKNIAAFLGQPCEVTLAGQSAGGASVHLNVLSPLTKGLFRRAIAQSGNALDRWAIQTAPEETSQRLAAAVNCSRDDPNLTVACLRGVSPPNLMVAAFGPALTDFDRNRLAPFTFVPTNDLPVPGVETFLPAPAIEMVKRKLHNPVPFLTGFTSRESFLDFQVVLFLNETVARILDASWDTKILPELSLPDDGDNNEEALRALRQFYMDGQPLTNDTLYGFMDMLTDIQFGKSVYFSLRIMAKLSKQILHQYIFDVSDELNTLKIQLNVTDIPGAGHGEDNNYLFRIEGLPEVLENSTAALARRRMVRLWTNYVKYGDPTPSADPLLQRVDWKPYTKHQRNYLSIGADLYSGKDLYKERVLFWKEFYRKFGRN